jgi:hypothetical protein
MGCKKPAKLVVAGKRLAPFPPEEAYARGPETLPRMKIAVESIQAS